MADNEPKGCLAAILRLFGIELGGSVTAKPEELPYRLRDDFLSPAELSFYRVLRLAVKEQVVICPKVNLSDLFFVTRPNGNQKYRNKIDRKHVDFVLCHVDTMRPLLGIELDDAGHQRADRVERDQFVDQVFQAAGLPLVRVPAKVGYDPKAIAAQLAPHLGGPPAVATTSSPSLTQANQPPICQKCGVPMVQRVASKGEHKGRQFWGCPNFPRCREVA